MDKENFPKVEPEEMEKESVMVNFTCHLDWAKGCPDNW